MAVASLESESLASSLESFDSFESDPPLLTGGLVTGAAATAAAVGVGVADAGDGAPVVGNGARATESGPRGASHMVHRRFTN